MPLKDLLWACPHCATLDGLDREGRCQACNTRFRRGRGARIAMSREGSPPEERAAAEWLERLPWADLDGEGRELPGGVAPPWEQAVQVRVAVEETILRQGAAYLGRVEVFGSKQSGRLRLESGRLTFTAPAGGWEWPLSDVSAVQPASSAIQLKASGRPVVSLRFPKGSVRLWEQRIKHAVRLAWREAGHGEITEFQPRIRAR